ncbi:MAG: hypothetical protein LC104_07830 [Bacteroidales bacterium]|nr:hypothetical protein [Bacteroidales bacterium]
MPKATRKVLSKFGAYVRQRAKTSIRKRKGISPPGSPPYSHVGLLKKFLFFAYDAERQSVVIGPTRIREASEAPKLLEHGGDTTLETKRGRQRIRYRPRPFMGPAFLAEQAKLPALWHNSVR